VKYLVLLDGVIFGKDRMHFGDFDIVRMTEKQLDRILETTINRTFFPSAVQDAKPFSNLWYLVTNGKRVALNSDSDTRSDSKNLLEVLFKPSPLRAEFSTLVAPIEEAVKTLLLWPWWRDSRDLALRHPIPSSEHMLSGQPRFPIVFAARPSPFAAPVMAPPPGIRYFAPLPPLKLSVDHNHEGWKRWLSKHPQFSYIGASQRVTGRSEPSQGSDGELRVLDAQDTSEFEKFLLAVLDARGRIAETKSCAWWELSLSFLLKAWNSNGLDQLLWEVVAIEALLGDRQEILAGIKRRIEVLLGPQIPLPGTVGKHKDSASTKRLFDELYDLRSKLVHGAPLESAEENSLQIGLGLAREVVTRMLVILSKLAGLLANKKLDRFPARAEVLEALDQIYRNQSDSLHPLAQMLQRVLRGSEDFS
jgi:hypothetical protein